MSVDDITRSSAVHIEVAQQVAELLLPVCGIRAELHGSGVLLKGRAAEGKRGIIAVEGSIWDEALRLVCILIRTKKSVPVPAEVLFRQLNSIGEHGLRYRLVAEKQDDEHVLGVEVGIALAPLSMVRVAQLKYLLEKIDSCGAAIQEHLPEEAKHEDIEALYEGINDHIAPTIPLDASLVLPPDIRVLAAQAVHYLQAAIPIALVAGQEIEEKYMLAAMARMSQTAEGPTIGRIVEDNISTRRVVELVSRAPGAVVLPVHLLALGNNELYDMDARLRAMYASLKSLGKAVVLTGSYTELQRTLNGGQGAVPSPVEPVILHTPRVSAEILLHFTVDEASRRAGGLNRLVREHVCGRVLSALQSGTVSEPSRFLGQMVRREIGFAQRGVVPELDAEEFLAALDSHRETFSGLTSSVAARCSPYSRSKMAATFTDDGFEAYLNEHLLAQGEGIRALVERLQTEALTRPHSQPIRCLVEGTPATGKSQAGKLIAERLGWERMVIDCSGIPDLYTLNSRLNGSARGIVNSHQPGLLEVASRHASGIVLEVSDLDHAEPQVRMGIADLFLMPLDAGVGQSSTGGAYNCTNMLIMFTVNLPGGRDEGAYNALGYHIPDQDDVQVRVETELGDMLSKAFLSRVGTPILFRPLSGLALRTIAARELHRALQTAFIQHGCATADIEIAEAAAALVVGQVRKKITSYGARVLLEHARTHAASAFVRFMRKGVQGTAFHVDRDEDVLYIIPKEEK